MFNLQGGEILIIAVLALVVLGPERLPDAMRRLGRALGQLRRMGAEMTDEFRAAVAEPMDELRGAVESPVRDLREAASGTAEAVRGAASADRATADAPSTDENPSGVTPVGDTLGEADSDSRSNDTNPDDGDVRHDDPGGSGNTSS